MDVSKIKIPGIGEPLLIKDEYARNIVSENVNDMYVVGNYYIIEKNKNGSSIPSGTIFKAVDTRQLSCDIQVKSNLFLTPVNNLEYVTVWNADSSGLTDSSKSIQECINYNAGKHVIIPFGKYLINNTITTRCEENEKIAIIGENYPILYSNTELTTILSLGNGTVPGGTKFRRSIVKNIKIESESCQYLIDIIHGNLDIENIILYTKQNGIRIGKKTYVDSNESTNVNIRNCYISGYDNKILNTIGIEMNGLDNEVNNCKIYGFEKTFVLNGSGQWINNVHDLKYFYESSPNDSYEAWERTVFAEIAETSRTNYFNKCYSDGNHTFLKGECSVNDGVTKFTLTDSFFYNYVENLDCTVFSFNRPSHFIISNNTIQLPHFKTNRDNNKIFEITNISFQDVAANGNIYINGNTVNYPENGRLCDIFYAGFSKTSYYSVNTYNNNKILIGFVPVGDFWSTGKVSIDGNTADFSIAVYADGNGHAKYINKTGERIDFKLFTDNIITTETGSFAPIYIKCTQGSSKTSINIQLDYNWISPSSSTRGFASDPITSNTTKELNVHMTNNLAGVNLVIKNQVLHITENGQTFSCDSVPGHILVGWISFVGKSGGIFNADNMSSSQVSLWNMVGEFVEQDINATLLYQRIGG